MRLFKHTKKTNAEVKLRLILKHFPDALRNVAVTYSFVCCCIGKTFDNPRGDMQV